MKENVPLMYLTFRTAWTVIHLFMVVAAVVYLLWWALLDNNAARIFELATNDVLKLQQQVANAIPWPWSAWGTK